MSGRTIEIVAPSRLHFGLLAFGRTDERQFGGAGAMVDRPGLRLVATSADAFSVRGRLAQRTEEIARQVTAALGRDELPACRLEVQSAPAEHVGLGLGTQLALAVASALCTWWDLPLREPVEMARLAGRGVRSAVGTYGFFLGGLIVEAGKWPSEPLGALSTRRALPEDWRFVLVRPTRERGLSGGDERQAFADLPPVSPGTTAELARLALLHLAPAAAAAHFEEFSDSLLAFNRLAGLCFAARQGGAYASAALARLIERMQESGARGVGQSSWGPTLFALLPDAARAATFAADLQAQIGPDHEIVVTAPNNTGAQTRVYHDGQTPPGG